MQAFVFIFKQFNIHIIDIVHYSWSHTIADLRSSAVWRSPAVPSTQSPRDRRASKVTQLHTALNNFKLATWKSRQKLAKTYPESLQSIGDTVRYKCLEYNIEILSFGKVHALKAFKNYDKEGPRNDALDDREKHRRSPKYLRSRSHSQARNSEIEYKWRELSKVFTT